MKASLPCRTFEDPGLRGRRAVQGPGDRPKVSEKKQTKEMKTDSQTERTKWRPPEGRGVGGLVKKAKG